MWLFDPPASGELPARDPAAVLVAGGGRVELGRRAGDCARDGRLHLAGIGTNEREPLARALHGAARAAAVRGQPQRATDRRGAALGAAPGPRAGAAWRSRTTTPASPTTSSSASRRPTRASAPRSSRRRPGYSPPTTPTPPEQAPRRPNFDPAHFAASTDTIYITAPRTSKRSARRWSSDCSSRSATPATSAPPAAAPTDPPVFLCLDEVANIAPIHDLPALVSEAGGQRLHVLACLQDLSQARDRWGEAAADGFLSLFQTKLILTGIADSRTLEAISLALGEYDRGSSPTRSGEAERRVVSAAGNELQERHLPHATAADAAAGGDRGLPQGQGLLLRGTDWGLLRLTPWYPLCTNRGLPSRARGRQCHVPELACALVVLVMLRRIDRSPAADDFVRNAR